MILKINILKWILWLGVSILLGGILLAFYPIVHSSNTRAMKANCELYALAEKVVFEDSVQLNKNLSSEINKKCGGQFFIENGKFYDSARIEILLVVKSDGALVLKREREVLTGSVYLPMVEVQIRRSPNK